MARNTTLEQQRFLVFQKMLVRVRFIMHCLRAEGVLHQFMTTSERLSQKGSAMLFNTSDERLYLRELGTEQLQRFANRMEADLARCIWAAAQQENVSVQDIAASCGKESDWVIAQCAWHDRYLRALRGSIEQPATRNEVMALAWAIANN